MTLSTDIKETLVIRHNENIDLLLSSLHSEGMKTTVMESSYNSVEETYSQSIKCLLTHFKAWTKCKDEGGVYLILEADFVPIIGIGALDLPCPVNEIGNAVTHIYSSAQRIQHIDNNNFTHGHSATAVAYIVNSQSAEKLLNICSLLLNSNHNLEHYLAWDIALPRLAVSANMKIYFPMKSYGEHGGTGNAEHEKNGINGTHRADVLMGKLHFPPTYSDGKKYKYYYTRTLYRFRALARLILGKFIEPKILFDPSIKKTTKIKMIKAGFKRLLT